MCTVPLASPCPAAEGFISTCRETLLGPFITKHLPSACGVRVHGDWAIYFVLRTSLSPAQNGKHSEPVLEPTTISSRLSRRVSLAFSFYSSGFQTSNLLSNPPLTTHSSFPRSVSTMPAQMLLILLPAS